MGLTKEVREFFTRRIHNLLDSKLAVIYEQIDREQIKKFATMALFKKVGVPTDKMERWNAIMEERRQLSDEADEIKNLIYDAIGEVYPHNRISRYRDDIRSEIEQEAMRQFEETVTEQLYPEFVPQISKLNHIKDEVEGVVLLSTTEPKLVVRLTAVLQKYGGDIQELLDYIPE